MLRLLVALFSGALFGLGLAVSGMANPQKVIGFLDVAGDWDPTLAFVMCGALLVTVPAFRMIFRRRRPVLAEDFELPTKKEVDGRLVGGSALFGVGWGLSGFCPGPRLWRSSRRSLRVSCRSSRSSPRWWPGWLSTSGSPDAFESCSAARPEKLVTTESGGCRACSSEKSLNEDLGCASYVVADGGEAAIIDPKWEIEEYLRIAEENGFRISHILETHNHADHLSGNGRLVEATGATIHVSEDAGVDYEHEPLEDGDAVEFGSMRDQSP